MNTELMGKDIFIQSHTRMCGIFWGIFLQNHILGIH